MNNNVLINDKYLYDWEDELAKIVKEKLKFYGNSNKERIKKETELFHLLCFFHLDNNFELYNKIIPNEPGDFLLQEKENNVVIEIVEIFGNKETYINIKNRLNWVFKRKISYLKDELYGFTLNESINKFNELFCKKNTDKKYLVDGQYNKKILLIVTGEYENCPATGNWIIKFLEEKDFEINKYECIWVLDYFSSSKDNGPTIIKNTIEEIKKYKNFFDKELSN